MLCWGGGVREGYWLGTGGNVGHKGFVECVVGVFYNFIVSLMCLSLSFIVLWFLLYFVYRS